MLVQDYRQSERSFEKKPTLPSKTVPDDSYSLKELITRFVRGQRVDVRTHEGQYYMDDSSADFDAPDYEKLAKADIHDRSEAASVLAAQTKEKAAKFKQAENQRKQKEKEDSQIMSDLKKDFIEKKKSVPPAPGDSAASKDKGGKE